MELRSCFVDFGGSVIAMRWQIPPLAAAYGIALKPRAITARQLQALVRRHVDGLSRHATLPPRVQRWRLTPGSEMQAHPRGQRSRIGGTTPPRGVHPEFAHTRAGPGPVRHAERRFSAVGLGFSHEPLARSETADEVPDGAVPPTLSRVRVFVSAGTCE